MKIKKLLTPKQVLELIRGKDGKSPDYIFQTGFWFMVENELEIGNWRVDGVFYNYKVTKKKTKSTLYVNDLEFAVAELLETKLPL